LQGGYPRGKPGKVRQFDIGYGKVREGIVGETVACLWWAVAVAIFPK